MKSDNTYDKMRYLIYISTVFLLLFPACQNKIIEKDGTVVEFEGEYPADRRRVVPHDVLVVIDRRPAPQAKVGGCQKRRDQDDECWPVAE